MTPQELAEFRELAGLNEPSSTEIQKDWADSQMTNQPKIENQAPMPTAKNFSVPEFHSQTYGGNSGEDKELDNLAIRLNSLLGSNDFKIERLK